MDDTPHYPEDDETSLLDLLQTIFDDLRVLVIGPIVAGLLALAGTSFWPKTYESTGILKVKAESSVTSIMTSAAVLDPIASSLGYLRWHLVSMMRFFLSPVYWRLRFRSRTG